jgi:hypothetical protein
VSMSTLEGPSVAADERALADWHDEQLAVILAAPAGEVRAALAARYGALLLEWAEEANAVRDVEVWRLKGEGWGPTRLANALGLHKSRGHQLLGRATEGHVPAQQSVARLRRRIRNRLRIAGQ